MRGRLSSACRKERLKIGQEIAMLKRFARDARDAQSVIAGIIKQECIPAILKNSELITAYVSN